MEDVVEEDEAGVEAESNAVSAGNDQAAVTVSAIRAFTSLARRLLAFSASS
jgi:hypothetical protein